MNWRWKYFLWCVVCSALMGLAGVKLWSRSFWLVNIVVVVLGIWATWPEQWAELTKGKDGK